MASGDLRSIIYIAIHSPYYLSLIIGESLFWACLKSTSYSVLICFISFIANTTIDL